MLPSSYATARGGDSRAWARGASTTLSASARRIAFTCTTLRPGCLREHPRDEPGDVRRGEAVAGGGDPLAVQPGDADVDAERAELDRRLRVAVVDLGVAHVVRGDGDHRGVRRREAGERHVVRRRDEHDVAEVGLVDQLVEQRVEVALGRAEAQVADLHAVLDRPAQAGGEHRAAAAQAGAEHLDAVSSQSGARLRMIPAQAVPWPKSSPCGSVSTSSSSSVLDDRRVLDAAADRRVVGVDAAVDHRDLDARARAAAPGPLARDLLGRTDPLERRQRVRARTRPTRRAAGLSPASSVRYSANAPQDLAAGGELALARLARSRARARASSSERADGQRDRSSSRRAGARALLDRVTRLLDRDRRLVREQAERVQVARRERRRALLVEQLERADHAVLVEERHAGDAVGLVADARADVLRPARVVARARDGDRHPAERDPAGDAVAERDAELLDSSALPPNAAWKTRSPASSSMRNSAPARAEITLAAVSTIISSTRSCVAGAATSAPMTAVRRRSSSASSSSTPRAPPPVDSAIPVRAYARSHGRTLARRGSAASNAASPAST